MKTSLYNPGYGPALTDSNFRRLRLNVAMALSRACEPWRCRAGSTGMLIFVSTTEQPMNYLPYLMHLIAMLLRLAIVSNENGVRLLVM